MAATFAHTVTERFLRYVTIDTQSSHTSDTFPSTEKQKDLGRLLVRELHEIGITDAHLDDYGYVYATVPSNIDRPVPVICFCAHMDTSPDCSGTNVKPQLVRNYQGGDIVLPADRSQVIRVADNPALKDQIGHDIITTDGTTLLGADNKAGVAEIVDAVNILVNNPQIRHGTLKILFTPDEEMGHGVDHVDIEKLGAVFGYTIDGESAGNLEDETSRPTARRSRCAGQRPSGLRQGQDGERDQDRVAHRRTAAARRPARRRPRRRARVSCIRPTLRRRSKARRSSLIVRDFTEDGLREKEELLGGHRRRGMREFPRLNLELTIEQQYRNMKVVLDRHPEVTAHALEAIRRAGLTPRRASIRGGTDGSRLSFMGLPCPNIFAGEHAFHSRLEWVSVQDMEKAVETIIHLAMIWAEQRSGLRDNFAGRVRRDRMTALPEADAATHDFFRPLAGNILGLRARGRLRVGAAAVSSRRSGVRDPSRRHLRPRLHGRRRNGTMCGRKPRIFASTPAPRAFSPPADKTMATVVVPGPAPAIRRTARPSIVPAAPRWCSASRTARGCARTRTCRSIAACRSRALQIGR